MKLIVKLLSYLPLSILQILGSGLGLLAYCLSQRDRQLLRHNLLNASKIHGFKFDPIAVAKSSGMMLTDSLWIWHHPQKALALTEIKDWDLVKKSIAQGRGLLMLTPHLGAFEMIPRILAEHFPATIIYKPAKQIWLNEIIEKGRAHPKMNFVPANIQGVRQIVRALQRGEAVGILPDQVPSVGEGVWSKFFGQYAYTAVLPAKIAQKNNVPTIVFAALRKPLGQGWEIRAHLIEQSFDLDPNMAAAQLNMALEKAILIKPNQYLWGYNRYKHPAGAPLPPENGH
ncbi:MAG: lysophospholipid acyltransferase family protein [Betaproteobacteria bacterium]|jgi:KDO2-lipid IV(A) lauroyltransferase